ncbi:MAG: response regulator [Alsobacter sp.]
MDEAQAQAEPSSFIVEGGEMGRRIRDFDWSNTPLGPAEAWPQSLKTVIRIMLTSRFAMWMAWGPELTFFCNDAYLPTTGLKRDWVLGARSDAVWSEIWPDIGPRIARVLATGEATWDEALQLYLERSGFPEETYHTFSYSPLADEAGGVVGMLCVVTEVTQRVIGERQLALLRDLGGRLAAASTPAEVARAVEASLAHEPRDIPFALVYATQGAVARRAVLHGLADTAPMAPAEVSLADPGAPWPLRGAQGAARPRPRPVPDGLPAALTSRVWPLPPKEAVVMALGDEDAGALGFFVAGLNPHRAADETYMGFVGLLAGQIAAAMARADAFEREQRRAEALAELDRAKTAFFSNVSHEFRTPLTLMLGSLEDVLALPGLPAEVAPPANVAHRNGLRLLRLVNALLDFSRIEAGRIQARYAPVDLATVTRDLASTFRSLFERAGLSFEVDCEPLGEEVFVDPDMWEKIVLNLVSNAFKFTLEGRVAVRLRRGEGVAELTVEDTGVGVPARELPRLFERFHRVEGTRGRSFEGSGIGLALVRDLVSLHSGTIEAQSEEGRGTMLRVRIPFGRDHCPPDTQAGPPPAGLTERARAYVDEASRWISSGDPTVAEFIADGDGAAPARNAKRRQELGRIVLADDNADLRDYVGRLLRARGYEVEAVPDGARALEAAKARRPDLLLTDVMMPELDGFGLLAAIRRDPALADLPVIMLSARAGEEAQVEGRAAGADDYLAKPFSARELLSRVSANLDMARLRHEAADALRRSEADLRRLTDAVPSFVYRASADGRILTVNARWTDYTGQTTEAARQQGWIEVVHPEDGPRLAGAFAAAAAEGRVFADEFRCRAKDGTYRWFYTVSEPEFDHEGRLVGWFGTSTDIHDRRQLEETRRRQERRDRFLLTLEDALRPLSEADAITGTAATLLGRELDVGRVCYVEVDEERGQCRVTCSYAAHGMPNAVGEYRLSSFSASIAAVRAGEALVVADIAEDPRFAEQRRSREVIEAQVVAILDVPLVKDGRLVGLLSVNQNAPRRWTEDDVELAQAVAERTWSAVQRARAEQTLHALNSELEQRVDIASRDRAAAVAQLHEVQKLETIGQLTGGVAHDFNNLLTPIVGALDLLRRRASLGPRDVRLLDAAQQSAERARTLIDRLLTFARRRHLEAQAVDLADLTAGMADLIERSLGSRIAVRYDCRKPATVMADPNQLELAILNLCVNARDAMPEGGELTLSVRLLEIGRGQALPPGRYVRLSVRDTGEGMDGETLKRAVEPFYTTKGIGKGTGLGLSMVHGLAAQSGGALTLDSEPGRGTAAHVDLPLVDAQSALAMTASKPAAKPTEVGERAALRILLVDDEELVRSATADMLGELGHTVREAGSGCQALQMLDGTTDLLVTDYMMPGLTGPELIQEVHKVAPGLPALLITGFANPEPDALAGVARINKPFTAAELADAILHCAAIPG